MTKRQAQRVLGKFRGTGLNLGDDRATTWLANNLSKIKTTMKQETFIDSSKTAVRKDIYPGRMFFFGYSPKTKDQLHFWDEFPVVVVIHPKRGGFLGLNLHYLPFSKRANFLNELLKYVDDPKYIANKNPAALMEVTYGMLKASTKLADFKPCIKRYYYNHVVTKVSFIPPAEWKTVPFFPLDKFKGASRADVWRLSR
jgi:hypothetical protein